MWLIQLSFLGFIVFTMLYLASLFLVRVSYKQQFGAYLTEYTVCPRYE
jgi:Trk-type K+ transport system membrane component